MFSFRFWQRSFECRIIVGRLRYPLVYWRWIFWMSGIMSEDHAYVAATLPVLGWFFIAISEKSSLYLFGGLRWCTPSRLLFPQSVGAAILVFCLGRRGRYGLFADLLCWDGEFSFSFPGVVCRISSVPAVLDFVHFATRIAFGFCRFILV